MTSPPASRLDQARERFTRARQLMIESRFAEAQLLIEEAIGLAPTWVEAHVLLARAQRQTSGHAAAEATVRNALEADPRHADAAHLLGGLLFEQDKLSASQVWFRTAVEIAPTVAQYQRDLGVVQLFLGQIDEGRASLQEALRLNPLVDEVVDTLAHVLPPGGDSTETGVLFAMLRDLVDRADLPPANRAQVFFGLGRIHEQRGEYDQAFAAITRGNALMRELVTWDARATSNRLARVAEIFDAAQMKRLAGHGDPTHRPVFVVGMPRSGSTLVEQIISAHPMVHGGGEVDILPRMVKGSRGTGGTAFPQWGASMEAIDCSKLAEHYLGQLPTGLPGQTRTTDKRLENFEYLGLIHLMMPQATIIHCRRDPRDSCFSALSLRFSQGQEYSYDMAELAQYWRDYDALMAHWREVLPRGKILEVQYEDLVADLEGWAPRIIGHCGLHWDEACLKFHEAKRPVRSASLAQVREPIFSRSIGRWKPFEAHLKPLLDGLSRG